MQFEIRAGGGRKGPEEAKTPIQIAQSANLILNPYLVVPITAPQTSVSAKGSKFKHISSVIQMFFVAALCQDGAAVLCCSSNLGKLLSNATQSIFLTSPGRQEKKNWLRKAYVV